MFLLSTDARKAYPLSQIKEVSVREFATTPPSHVIQIEMLDGTFLTPKEQYEGEAAPNALINTLYAMSHRPLVVEGGKP